MSLPLPVGADVERRLDAAAAADALEAALRAGFDPEDDPPRSALELGGGELLVMPSAVGGQRGGEVGERRRRAANPGRCAWSSTATRWRPWRWWTASP